MIYLRLPIPSRQRWGKTFPAGCCVELFIYFPSFTKTGNKESSYGIVQVTLNYRPTDMLLIPLTHTVHTPFLTNSIELVDG